MADRLTKLIAGCLDMDPVEISNETGTQNLAKWDSLRHMRIVFALEEDFNVRFRDQELMSLTSVAAIRDALRERNIAMD
jgi:acyl carrier protein